MRRPLFQIKGTQIGGLSEANFRNIKWLPSGDVDAGSSTARRSSASPKVFTMRRQDMPAPGIDALFSCRSGLVQGLNHGL